MSTLDTPIAPATIDKFSDAELDKQLNGIRDRRLRAFKIYQEAEQERKETHNQKLATQLSKHINMFNKELAQLDKVLEKVEARALKIRAVKMELED